MRIISMAAVLLTLSLAGLNAQADVYQWKDAQGRVHFADQAPPDKADVKVVEKSPTDAADTQPGAATAPAQPKPPRYHGSGASRDHERRVTESLEQERKQKAEERKRKLEDKNRLETECNALKAEIAHRSKINLFIQHNKDGGIRYTTDAERAKDDAVLQQKYQEKCEKLIKLEERKQQRKVGDDL